MRAVIVALAMSSLAFVPASTAFALAADTSTPPSPRAVPVTQPNGGPGPSNDAKPVIKRAKAGVETEVEVDSESDTESDIESESDAEVENEPKVDLEPESDKKIDSDTDSDVVQHFSPGAGKASPPGKPGVVDPGESPTEEDRGDQVETGKSGTTATTPPATTTTTHHPATTTTVTPTTEVPTSTTLLAPAGDDDSSDEAVATKASGTISKPPAGTSDDPGGPSTRSTALPTPDDESRATGTALARDFAREHQMLSGWDYLTQQQVSALRSGEAVGMPRPAGKASLLVLNWLVERDSTAPAMAIVGPLVVLLTIWEAAASAGSGLAAPASALGTFVLIVLFEKRHLVDGARLFRRRIEA